MVFFFRKGKSKRYGKENKKGKKSWGDSFLLLTPYSYPKGVRVRGKGTSKGLTRRGTVPKKNERGKKNIVNRVRRVGEGVPFRFFLVR